MNANVFSQINLKLGLLLLGIEFRAVGSPENPWVRGVIQGFWNRVFCFHPGQNLEGKSPPWPLVLRALNRYGQWQQLCVCTLWSKWLASEKDPNHLRQQITKDSKVSPCDHSLGYCLKGHIAMRSCFQYQTNWWTKRHFGKHRVVISENKTK